MAEVKDWIKAASVDIVTEVLSLPPSDVDIAQVLFNTVKSTIQRHCPFKPNTAYVPLIPAQSGTVQDWAAECARYLASVTEYNTPEATQARIAAVITVFAKPLLVALNAARRSHHHCDDSWYCCGKCQSADHALHDDEYIESHNHRTSGVCDCGADEVNKKIDEALT